MRRFRWLALLLCPLPVLAQPFEVSSVTDPIRPDRAPLALTEEVPAIFHLGLDGPAPLFVNPARAARAKHRFVYGTVRPDFSAEAPVSFAGLFGEGERRWLLTAENGVRVNESTDTRMETVTETPGEGVTIVREQNLLSESADAATSTRARALLIGRTDFGGYAFGLYGGYRNRTDERLQTMDLRQETDRTVPRSFMQTVLRDDRSEQQANADRFGVGVETALAGRTWDLAGAVSYQRATEDAAFSTVRMEDRDSEETLFDGSLQVRSDDDDLSVTNDRDREETAVDVELLGALRVGERRDDYLFASVEGTFGSGTEDYAAAFSERRVSRTEVDGEVVNEIDFSEEFSEAGALDLDRRATRVSLGYVYARSRRGVTVLAALNPSGGFEHTETALVGASPERVTVSRQETDRTTLALTLPLFVRFDVTKRLEAFGGGVYTYAYTHTESETRPVRPEVTVPEDLPNELTSERTTDTFVSDSRLYAGAVFTFRSGLTAQASLRGTLAEITRWTVSLGYRF